MKTHSHSSHRTHTTAGFLLAVAFFIPFMAAAPPARRALTLEDRVRYQRAIEAVNWQYRIWPKENPQPKPPLDDVMPLSAIRAKVKDDLRQSQALEVIWNRPVTAAVLQREMERMARDTKQPERLLALFAALGNDAFVIAECLARPALSQRLIRASYAGDERFHGTLRQRIEADVQAHGTVAAMKQMSGEYAEAVWVQTVEGRREAEQGEAPALRLAAKEWRERREHLQRLFGGEIHLSVVSPVEEGAEGYAVTAVLEEMADRMKVATVTWRKRPFAEWWAETSLGLAVADAAAGAGYRLPALRAGGAECPDDTWQPTSLSGAPNARYSHTAVWTGTEMIVWGGFDGFSRFNTGGRYDPAIDTWWATSLSGVPGSRSLHAAVWTGMEMIVWGGTPTTNTGGRYDPANDTWLPTSQSGAPSGRRETTAVWTGMEMIVWGGYSGSFHNTGGRYDPATDAWQPTSLIGAPSARAVHTAVWTGTEVIVWGGQTASTYFNTGGRYDPATDTWVATRPSEAPSFRSLHTAVWTGTEMIVWGGRPTTNTGGRYDPATDTWLTTSQSGAPSPREQPMGVWTGTEMIVWGGNPVTNTGGRYCARPPSP